jgi:hypothetical protein
MNNTKKISKKALLLALCICTIMITVTCDPMYYRDGRHSYITLENNSEIDVCAYGTENYPDTTINHTYPTWYSFMPVKSNTSEKVVPCSLGDWWELIFDITDLQCVSVFVFDKTFLEPHIRDGNFIVTETMAVQRYDLTLEDLNSLNWTIFYPPNERMKDVKMYPPYGK